MSRIAPILVLTAILLLPAPGHAHDGLHELLGLEHGATTAGPLLFDLAAGLLLAGGLVLGRRLWRRPAALGAAAIVVLVAATGLLAL